VIAVALLATVITIGIVGQVSERRVHTFVDLDISSTFVHVGRFRDRRVAGVVALMAAIFVQSWFTLGTVIAGWDAGPPQGTAWITRLFTSWFWSGSNMGGPGAMELQSPWAALLWLVGTLGGSAELAQRLWYTVLVVAAVLAAFCLLRLLRIAAIPAAIGSLVYVFNPNSLSTDIYPVYLVAMVLLAGLPALVLAGATGRLSFKKVIILFGVCAPLLGYTYQNPPLTGMILFAVAASIFIALALEGRTAAKSAMKLVLGGGLLLIAASAYWIVPSLVQLQGFKQASYTPLTSWIWEEGRATLVNGLWLNMTWAWNQATFYPYASAYGVFPLTFVKFLLPAVAFSSIPLAYSVDNFENSRTRRLVLGIAGMALFLIVLSTGTNFPGAVIFDPLYHLPFGWLLREPFRFLMVVGLAYGVLIAVTLQLLGEVNNSMTSPTTSNLRRLLNVRVLGVFCLAIIVLIPAYPLFFGQYVRDQSKGGTALMANAPAHVTFPAYWTNMASFVNGQFAPQGNLLALPLDGPSNMVAYRWGYVGSDAFVPAQFDRNVIDPNPSNYFGISPELIDTVNTMTAELLNHDWSSFSKMANALEVKLVLVRGDFNTNLLGSTSPPPTALSASLKLDPRATLVHRDGPLELFLLRSSSNRQTAFATVNSSMPNLRALSLLPLGTSLVSGRQRPGVEALLQFPAVNNWDIQNGALTTTMLERPGWNYRLFWITTSSPPSVVAGTQKGGPSISTFHSQSMRQSSGELIRISLPIETKSLLPNGNFTQGSWNKKVVDCNNGGVAKPPGSIGLKAQVNATSGPGGTPALSLSANADVACEATTVDWKSGPILISLWARTIRGAPPRVCIWQAPNYGCPYSNILVKDAKWKKFRFVVQPQPNTTSLQMFLFADSNNAGLKTVTQYSNITINSISSRNLQPILIGTPSKTIGPRVVLTTTGEGYDKGWVAPTGYSRVLVDGLRTGWLGPTRVTKFSYLPGVEVRDGLLLSIASFLAIGALTFVSILRRITRFRTKQREKRTA
jgi:hypothetical protein